MHVNPKDFKQFAKIIILGDPMATNDISARQQTPVDVSAALSVPT